jgi:hypothetical protein
MFLPLPQVARQAPVRCRPTLAIPFSLLTLVNGLAGDPAKPVEATTQASVAVSALRVAWHGAKMILKKVEGSLDGTLAKVPVAAFNALIEIGDVCSDSMHLILPADRCAQAVVDNNDTLRQYVAQAAERLKIMDAALQQAESEDAKVRIKVFARYVPV